MSDKHMDEVMRELNGKHYMGRGCFKAFRDYKNHTDETVKKACRSYARKVLEELPEVAGKTMDGKNKIFIDWQSVKRKISSLTDKEPTCEKAQAQKDSKA